MNAIENSDLKNENCKFEISNLKLRRAGVAPPAVCQQTQFSIFNFRPRRRRGFTLVELLVVITIIALLAGMALRALAKASERGKLDATKSTVAKINDLVMRRYESYRTRRVPLNLTGVNPNDAAFARLIAIRYLMLTEMPQCFNDIKSPPGLTMTLNVKIGNQTKTINQTLQPPALSQMYRAKLAANGPSASADPNHQQAQCLYLWVTTTFPEAKGLFRGEEVATIDGMKCFVDGWGNPIGFLRWAPGASAWSDIQVADATNHHDPFDPMLLENGPGSYANKAFGFPNAAYQLYPLVFAGVLGKDSGGHDDYGITLTTAGGANWAAFDPFTGPYLTGGAIATNGGVPLVTNHHIEAR